MAELSLLSSQTPQSINPRSAWMWNPKEQVDDDSWEVRAFAEDTGNVMGTTWPPRSYTCTFCRREFRSAQALGGHMNVHRRDRARLHQVQQPSGIINPSSAVSSSSSASSFMIPTQEFLAANSGLCLLYQLAPDPGNNGGAFPTTSTTCATNASLVGNNNTTSSVHETSNSSSLVPSTLFSISPNPLLHDYLMTSSSGVVGAHSRSESHCQYRKRSAGEDIQPSRSGVEDSEELDLELRIGPS